LIERIILEPEPQNF